MNTFDAVQPRSVRGGWSLRGYKGKGGGGGARQPVEAADSLHSTSYARVLDLLSEGEIEGLVNDLRSIYLDGTPLANADGSLNFAGVTADFRSGTQTQEPIPGFPSAESPVAVGLELKAAMPWVRAINNRNLSAVRVTLGVNGLSKANTENGDISGYTIDYAIDLQTDGGAWIEVLAAAFSGKTTQEYRRTHRIDLPTAAIGWTLRVRRLTQNANTNTVADTTVIESITDVIDAKLRYPMSALVGLQVDASQFQGSVPTRAYHVRGRVIRVPSNYDPELRGYTGIWDGTFKSAYSNNPAWVFYDLATNDRYGLGKSIPAAWVNKWTLYQIGVYCDGLVSNGRGGMEPRFTCNAYLQTRGDATRVLQDLCSIFRGMVYWAAGAAVPVADMPRDPAVAYSQADVLDGRFSYSGSRLKDRHTVALVSYNDMTDFGHQKVVYYQDDEAVARYGIRQVEISAFGCTSEAQALRVGQWAVLTAQRETRSVSFSLGLKGTLCSPGQVIEIADSALAGHRMGGLLKSATVSEVVLDAPVTAQAGDSITVTLPTGMTESRRIAYLSMVDGAQHVGVNPAFDAVPVAESSWAISTTEIATQLFTVMSVTEGSGAGLTFDVTAIQHEPGKFAAIDQGAPLAERPVSKIPAQVLPTPIGVVVGAHSVTAADGTITTTVTAGWSVVADAAFYEIEWSRSQSGWVRMPRTALTAVDIPNAYSGDYLVRVRAISVIDTVSAWGYSAATAVAATALPPRNFDTFLVSELASGMRQYSFSYTTQRPPADLAGAEVRYVAGSPENIDWQQMRPLDDGGYYTNSFESTKPEAGLWTFALRARSRSGVLSEGMLIWRGQLLHNVADAAPDLTPPPPPIGLDVSTSLANIHLGWDQPKYMMGHGHQFTRVYAAQITAAQPAPGRVTAEISAEIIGPVGSIARALGTSWRLWFVNVTNDGVESVDAGPVDATVGKIGNSDLGPLIVEAGNLANGAVSASKLAAQAVDATKFASGIEPVTNSTASTLPTVKSTTTITWQGKLYRWDGSKYSAAVPTTDLTGTIIASQIAAGAIDATKFASGIEPVSNSAAASLPTVKSTTVITWQGKLYRWDGSKYTAEVSSAELADNAVTVNKIAAGAVEAGKLATGAVTADKIAAAAVDATKFASGIEPVTNSAAASLPTVKSTNVITWQGKLYRWDGAKYTPEVAAVDLTGQLQSSQLADNAVTTAKIASGAVDTAKFAAGIQPVTVSTAGTLPTVKTTETLVWKGKLYRWSGTAYTAAVATADLTGQIIAGQIAAGAVDATKFASGIEPVTNATGGSLPTTKSTAVITWSGKLYRWDGTKYSAEVAVGDMVGQIAATQIADNAITTPKLAANSVAAGKIAANAVTANEISANAVTAAKIAAGAVGADQIAANAITAKHLTLGDFTNLWPNPLFDNAEAGWVGLAANIAQYSGTEGKGVLITATTTTAAAVVASDASVITSGMMACRGGEKLYLSATVTRKVGAAAKVASLQVQYLNVNGTSATVSALSGTSSGTAVDFGGEYTLPATAVAFRLRAQMNATNVAGDAIALTNIVARRMNTGELIVDGAISASKIAALAITADKIAANAVTADSIAANAVTTAKIAAGAVTAAEIAANAIVASKLAVADFTNLVPDSNMEDPAAWEVYTGWVFEPLSSAGFISSGALSYTAGTGTGTARTRMFSVEEGSQYFVSFQATGPRNYCRVYFYDAAKVSLGYASLSATSLAPSITATALPGAKFANVLIGPLSTASAKIGGFVARKLMGGELIVDGAITATKIAAKSITAAQLAAGAVTANELAANAVTAGKIAANAITADNLQANSVTTAKIATGAVSANEIAAGAITAAKLAITSQDTVNIDPFFEDLSLWSSAGLTRKQIAGSPGPNVIAASTSISFVPTGTKFAIDTSKTYLLETWFMASATSPNRGFTQSRFFDVNGAQIVGADAVAPGWPATNNSGSTGNFYFPGTGMVTSTTWTRHTITVGPEGTAKFPAKAAYMTIGAFLNYAGVAPIVESYWGGVRVIEMSRGELIVDGAITAAKIAAKTITAAEIAAGTITATELGANSVTANAIAANSVIAGKIAANAVTADSIAANSVTTAKIAAGAVSATELAAGSVLASKLLVADTTNPYGDFDCVDPNYCTALSGSFSYSTSGASFNGKNIVNIPPSTGFSEIVSNWFSLDASAEYLIAQRISTSVTDTVGFASGYIELGTYSGSGAVVVSRRVLIGQNTTTSATPFSLSVLTSSSERYGRIVFTREAGGTARAYLGAPIIRRKSGGNLIVDGAITASKMVLADTSNAYPDFDIQDDAGYSSASAFSFTSASSSYGSRRVVWIQAPAAASGDATVWAYANMGFQLEANSQYFVSMQTARQAASAATLQIVTRLGVKTTNTAVTWDSEVVQNSDAAASASPYKTFTISTGTRTRMTIGMRLLAGAATGGYFGAITVRKMNGAELIVDGAIIAGKIAANAVTADKIEANAITAAKIAAGAVGADQIAANSITAKQLVVSDFANLIPDPDLGSFAQGTWYPSSTTVGGIARYTSATGNGIQITKSTGQTGELRAYTENWRGNQPSNFVPVKAGDMFRSICTITRKAGTDTGLYAGIYAQLLNADGTTPTVNINGRGLIPNAIDASIDVSGQYSVPAGTIAMRFYATYASGAGSAGSSIAITNIAVRRMNSAELIVDGAITASKLSANAIAVGTAAIQNGALINAMIANATIDSAKIANLNAAKITGGAMQVGSYINSANYSSGNAGWSINSDGNAEFCQVTVRGSIFSNSGSIGNININANGLNSGGFSGYQWPAAGQNGFHIGQHGILLGNANSGRYVEIQSSGNIYAPGLRIENGNATFSGNLAGASGSFSGTLTAQNVVTTGNLQANAATVNLFAQSGSGSSTVWTSAFDGAMTCVVNWGASYTTTRQEYVYMILRVDGAVVQQILLSSNNSVDYPKTDATSYCFAFSGNGAGRTITAELSNQFSFGGLTGGTFVQATIFKR